jgi:hypothetical protein
VDCAGLSYVSEGLAGRCHATAPFRDGGGRVRLRAGDDHRARMLRVLGYDEVLALEPCS